MDNFKLLYDRVVTAQASVETIRNQITDALALATPAGEEQALALEATLDAAIADEKKWHDFYDKVVNSAKTKNPLDAFVPLDPKNIPDETKTGKTMKRAEWQALSEAERGRFIRSGGILED